MENIYKNIERIEANQIFGLSNENVALRLKQNLSNADTSVPSRSIFDIFKKNVFTLFNFVNFVLALSLIYTGSYKNLMFMGVVICNCVIGIIQEIRAKKAIDKLKLINENSVKAIREGKEVEIGSRDVVLDDIIKYHAGSQIIADAVIIEGNCEVNEAMLTGEADLIYKQKGDSLFSGSFIASGNCFTRTEHVGSENYASKIYKGAKYVKESNSEIMNFLKKLIKFISIAIIPIGGLLFFNQLRIFSYNINPAIVGTTSALIGMIPEGLVLLTSTALALSVLRLSKRNALVQDLYCIEALAKVDTLCLDKTGTITEGILDVSGIVPQKGFTESDTEHIMELIISVLNDSNETFNALKRKFKKDKNSFFKTNLLKNEKVKDVVPFSSDRKWSGVSFEKGGSYVIGAAEFIFKEMDDDLKKVIENLSRGYRVIILAKSENYFVDGKLPEKLIPVSLILLNDKIKESAKSSLAFFNKKGVNIKVISGDNPITVSGIAKRAGILNYNAYIDMSDIKEERELKEAAKKYTVFGRVSPLQKRDLIKALKEQGHTVAMTGDGVNDVLALKEADCSIAMAKGSDAARVVSQIVLLNSEFSSMSDILSEGQRVINNIQRASTLFLVKTVYSFALAILFLTISAPYPFIPIQMTLISSLAIGIPSFVLALEPNTERIKDSFVKNILKHSVPTAIIIILNIILCILSYRFFNLSYSQYSTLCVALTGVMEITLLHEISCPLNLKRKILIVMVSIIFVFALIFFKNLFSVTALSHVGIVLFISILSFDLIFKRFMLKFISK